MRFKMLIYYNSKLTDLAKKLRRNQTYAEKIFWQIVRNDNLGYDFHRQKPIGNYIYDFYCHKLKLVIEIDGITHLDNNVKNNDLNKDKYAESLGLRIVRFTDDEVIGNSNMIEKRLKGIIFEIEKDTPPLTPPF